MLEKIKNDTFILKDNSKRIYSNLKIINLGDDIYEFSTYNSYRAICSKKDIDNEIKRYQEEEITKKNLNEIKKETANSQGYIIHSIFGLIEISEFFLEFDKYIDIFEQNVSFMIYKDQNEANFEIEGYFLDLYFKFLGNQKKIKELLQKSIFKYYKKEIPSYYSNDGSYEKDLKNGVIIKKESDIWKLLSETPLFILEKGNQIELSFSCDWDIEHGIHIRLKNWKIDDIW